MARPRRLAPLVFTMAVAVAAAITASGAKAAEAAASPVVVELFTSQGCYSCPPAEAYLGKLAGRADVVALEFHVDYWDDLVYGSAGKWKDPFSSPQFTQRQRSYNAQIRKTGGVYTPQMVIGGNRETVGSHENKVEKAISQLTRTAPLTVEVRESGAAQLTVQIDGTGPAPASVWLVRFHRTIETRVRSGENKGKTLTSHNIVTGVQKIADWTGGPLSLEAASPAAGSGQGCAVLVQQAPGTPILGASYCPGARSS
ncbi:MAG: DUF1223 domain-containing protein [Rhodospirillales bacterium]|nr:DUF1223 domain-containing protein [Rhodospirillales bacterium]